MMKEYWGMIMDAERNPLRSLPVQYKYQIMIVLAMMWSFIFCAMVGWMMLFPYWVLGHIALVTLGAWITNRTFKSAHIVSHRDRYRSQDGTHALHDDIWGA
jgi:hypothetical protein